MTPQTAALILAWAAIILLGLALSGVLRQLYQVRRTLGGDVVPIGPRVGDRAPSLDGRTWEQPTVLLFVREDCEPCKRLAPEFINQAAGSDSIDFQIVSSGTNGFRSYDRVKVASDPDGASFTEFGISITPFAVGIVEGRIATASPIGSEQLLGQFVSDFKGGLVADAQRHPIA